MADEVGVVCDIAQDRHRGAVIWRNLWTLLLWIVGLSVVIFLVMAVLYLIQEDWLPAALLTLGSIAEGLGLKWVTDRRTDAAREEEEMYKDVEVACRIVRR